MFQRLSIPPTAQPLSQPRGAARRVLVFEINGESVTDRRASEGGRELGTFQAFACPRRRARRWPCWPGPPSWALAGGWVRG
jgi:hypothetical protein